MKKYLGDTWSRRANDRLKDLKALGFPVHTMSYRKMRQWNADEVAADKFWSK